MAFLLCYSDSIECIRDLDKIKFGMVVYSFRLKQVFDAGASKNEIHLKKG